MGEAVDVPSQSRKAGPFASCKRSLPQVPLLGPALGEVGRAGWRVKRLINAAMRGRARVPSQRAKSLYT